MVYLFLNRSKILNPLIEEVKTKYPSDSHIIYTDPMNKSIFGTEPFWDNKWLLLVSGLKQLKKDFMHLILCSDKVDTLIEVSTQQIYNDIVSDFIKEKSEIELRDKNSKYNYFMENPHSKEEIQEYLNDLKLYSVSAYKMGEEYYERYCKYILLYNTMNISWEDSKEIMLDGEANIVIKYLASKLQGNADYITGILELAQPENLTLDLLNSLNDNIKEKEFITVYNYPIFGLSRTYNRQKEIQKVLYKCSTSSVVKQFKEFLKSYEKVYTEYINGNFNKFNVSKFIKAKGRELKITSDFMAKEWLGCLTQFSYERYLITCNYVNNKDISTISKYNYIVNLMNGK